MQVLVKIFYFSDKTVAPFRLDGFEGFGGGNCCGFSDSCLFFDSVLIALNWSTFLFKFTAAFRTLASEQFLKSLANLDIFSLFQSPSKV